MCSVYFQTWNCGAVWTHTPPPLSQNFLACLLLPPSDDLFDDMSSLIEAVTLVVVTGVNVRVTGAGVGSASASASSVSVVVETDLRWRYGLLGPFILWTIQPSFLSRPIRCRFLRLCIPPFMFHLASLEEREARHINRTKMNSTLSLMPLMGS